MGLAPRDDAAGVRWVAVRHGQSSGGIDHVHVVATLARQDGTLPSVHNDYARARKVCLTIEKQFGLLATATADCTAAPRPTRAETEQAHRGPALPPRSPARGQATTNEVKKTNWNRAALIAAQDTPDSADLRPRIPTGHQAQPDVPPSLTPAKARSGQQPPRRGV